MRKQCKICGRKLTRSNSIEVGIGPICESKVIDRFGFLFKRKTMKEWLEGKKFCSQCKFFCASKRGSKTKTKYALHLVNKDDRFEFEYDTRQSIVGLCEKYRKFVDGNLVTRCKLREKR